MIRQTLAHFPYGAMSGLGMLLFIAVFFGAFAWVYRRGSRDHYQAVAQAALTESDTELLEETSNKETT